MRLDPAACWSRVGAAGHGALGTVHPDRGVDAVPVVFVTIDDVIAVPIDTVKPKSGRRLQRLSNIEADPRVVLLVDHYADDWSQLWWVRIQTMAAEVDPTTAHLGALAHAFPAYGPAGTVTRVLVLTPTEITGWAAT